MVDVVLTVDGQRYGGWQEIRVQRSIEQLAGQFALSVTERWAEQDTPRPIRPGAACQVLIDGTPVITGYVDDVDLSYDATTHTVSVAGRDRTGDLCDCSAPVKGGTLNGQTLLSAAQRLCAPFGIKVVNELADVPEVTTTKFTALRANPGDSIFARLDTAARVRAVLLATDGAGNLVITRTSTERLGTLVLLGDNVLAASARFSHRDRFSEYTVTGQMEASGTDTAGAAAFHLEGAARDAFITRHRPLILSATDLGGTADARRRAQWERNVRYGRAQALTYTLQGWHYAPGQLWPINRLVPVIDEHFGINDDLLLAGVEFTLADDGLRTVLTLMPPAAFEPEPLPPTTGDRWDQI